MDDIIFLIIAVALSIFAALKKNKQKDAGDNPLLEDDKESHNYFMDQLLGDDFLSDPEEPVVKAPRPQAVTAKVPEVVMPKPRTSKMVRTGFGRTMPDHSLRTTHPSTRSSVPEESAIDAEDGVSSYKTEFTLRKAFVYSEIMNPKYIDTYN